MDNLFDTDKSTDEILNEIKKIIEDNTLGNRVVIARLYGLAKNSYEDVKTKEVFKQKANIKNITDITLIDSNNAIIQYKNKDDILYKPICKNKYTYISYKSFDEALIGLLCSKTNNEMAFEYICKMLEVDKSEADKNLEDEDIDIDL